MSRDARETLLGHLEWVLAANAVIVDSRMRAELRAALDNYDASISPAGDIEGQAKAWCRVWDHCAKLGMVDQSTDTATGAKRVCKFVDRLVEHDYAENEAVRL